ncbi:PQQ-dependent sugar dehydrogenase [Phytomonospora sp. NPDC050363]|uniref:PQQ-dependent sugar dehydrogenase n=1 Tax=Phytomonospora sp. NPDC050363 TaxID=3155642 RepID=UPI0033EC2D33
MRIAKSIAVTAALAATTFTGVCGAEAQTAADADFDFDAGEQVAAGLTYPWGLSFLPDGTAIFAERNSALIKTVAPGTPPQTVGQVPTVVPGGEGGLLGLAVSPDYAVDETIYVYFTAAGDNRVARLTLADLTPEPIVTGIPKASIHNGGRIEFGPDGKLYIATGDAGNRDNSQDPGSLGGKILRVNPDGTVPEDNPFPGSRVYTLGHRNVQGLDWTGGGELYASELGQNTWDEVNHIVAGDNYGWPVVEGEGGEPEFHDPLVTWTTAEASPSGAAVVADTMYVAALRGQRLWTVPLAGGEPVAVLTGTYGRVRSVEHGPDGWLWICTSNGSGDVIVRFPPV